MLLKSRYYGNIEIPTELNKKKNTKKSTSHERARVPQFLTKEPGRICFVFSSVSHIQMLNLCENSNEDVDEIHGFSDSRGPFFNDLVTEEKELEGIRNIYISSPLLLLYLFL
jgi:hypothetical protein